MKPSKIEELKRQFVVTEDEEESDRLADKIVALILAERDIANEKERT